MKKIFPTILFLFVVITVFTIPTITDRNTLRTNFEIDHTKTTTNKVYLLDKNNYLVEVDVFLPKNDLIENLIYYLKEDNEELEEWNGYIPKNTEILDYKIEDKILMINFSKEFENIEKDYIPGLVHSLLKIKEIQKVEILVENKHLKDYENVLDKSLPINKEYDIHNRKDIEKVVVYYIDNIENNNLVPITKYCNTKEEKIEIILEELKNNIPKNLVSYIPNNLKLISYEQEPDMLILNFNEELTKDSSSKETIIKEISSSIFDNYEVSSILYKVDGKLLEIRSKNG